MKALVNKFIGTLVIVFSVGVASAQGDAKVDVKIDANQILVGDQVRYFIEAQHNAMQSRLQWATIPDTFNKLEVVERGKIDTVKQGDIVTYKQRLLITGFDSGVFVIPSFVFPVIPNNGTAYTVQADSFPLLVQTVAVDTTQPFKGIKEIMPVKSTWLDYIWYIIGALVFLILLAVIIIYFVKNKKVEAPVVAPPPPKESLQEQALRMLAALERKQLWQGGQVKEYYVELTDILRGYIEARFNTPAMELTTDDMLESARLNREMNRHAELLGTILYTADLAKFAKAQPLPHEHTNAMELAIKFVHETKPAETPQQS
ncbi:MAG: hypothetical protein K0R82_2359 [Flavipsychrobacter sp.]|jgi:hypothetical protein|nr:hypothetical protein [Flavipsychrobacter sp.]